MAKGKHVMDDVASDQDAYLKDDYHELCADNANLEDVEDKLILMVLRWKVLSLMEMIMMVLIWIEVIWIVLREMVLIS